VLRARLLILRRRGNADQTYPFVDDRRRSVVDRLHRILDVLPLEERRLKCAGLGRSRGGGDQK
jgi:hypothetical protein